MKRFKSIVSLLAAITILFTSFDVTAFAAESDEIEVASELNNANDINLGTSVSLESLEVNGNEEDDVYGGDDEEGHRGEREEVIYENTEIKFYPKNGSTACDTVIADLYKYNPNTHEYTLKFTAPAAITENGYEFMYWSTSRQKYDAAEKDKAAKNPRYLYVSAGESVTFVSKNSFSCEFYSIWTEDESYDWIEKYTVTYDLNGGTSKRPIVDDKVYMGRDTSPGYHQFKPEKGYLVWEDNNVPTMNGYNFVGYSTVKYEPGDISIIDNHGSDGRGDFYSLSALNIHHDFSVNGNITFYAVWDSTADVFEIDGTTLVSINIPYEKANYFRTVYVPDGITTIGNGTKSIYNFESYVNEIVLPNSVTTINAKAFYKEGDRIAACVVLPETVTNIDDDIVQLGKGNTCICVYHHTAGYDYYLEHPNVYNVLYDVYYAYETEDLFDFETYKENKYTTKYDDKKIFSCFLGPNKNAKKFNHTPVAAGKWSAYYDYDIQMKMFAANVGEGDVDPTTMTTREAILWTGPDQNIMVLYPFQYEHVYFTGEVTSKSGIIADDEKFSFLFNWTGNAETPYTNDKNPFPVYCYFTLDGSDPYVWEFEKEYMDENGRVIQSPRYPEREGTNDYGWSELGYNTGIQKRVSDDGKICYRTKHILYNKRYLRFNKIDTVFSVTPLPGTCTMKIMFGREPKDSQTDTHMYHPSEITTYNFFLAKDAPFYAIKFNSNIENDKQKMDSLTTCMPGEDITLPKNTFERDMFEFIGWNTKADGSGTWYSDEETVSFNLEKGQTLELFAQWKGLKYKIEYSNSSKSNIGEKKLAEYANRDAEYTVIELPISWSRRDAEFTGWNTKMDGSGTDYASGTKLLNTLPAGETLTLYAQYKKIEVPVIFDANGGEGSMSSFKLYLLEEKNLPENEFTYDDYSFMGWSVTRQPVGTVCTTEGQTFSDKASLCYEDIDSSVRENPVTLYAMWVKTDSIFEIDGTILVSINPPAGTKSLTIPDSVTTIGGGVNGIYKGENNLADLFLPASVTTIAANAFIPNVNTQGSLTNVENIHIPATVTDIADLSINPQMTIFCDRNTAAFTYAKEYEHRYNTEYFAKFQLNDEPSDDDITISLGNLYSDGKATITAVIKSKIMRLDEAGGPHRYLLAGETSSDISIPCTADENGVITLIPWHVENIQVPAPVPSTMKRFVPDGTAVTFETDPATRTFYTLDGTEPVDLTLSENKSNTSTLEYYGNPFTIENDTIIKIFSIPTSADDDYFTWLPSNIATYKYRVDSDAEFDADSQGEVLDEDLPGTDEDALEDRISNIEEGFWTTPIADGVYNGAAQTRNFRVYYGKLLLTNKKDYTVVYKNNKNAGTATITIKGKGNFKGTIVKTFTIEPFNIENATMATNQVVLKYNKKLQKATNTFTYMPSTKVVTINNKNELVYQYSDTTTDAYKAIGSYTVTVSGKGNFTGTRTFTETITETGTKSLSKAAFAKALTSSKPYTGTAIEPVVADGDIDTATVTYKLSKTEIVALKGITRTAYNSGVDASGYDYIYEYIGDTTKIGTVSVRFTGINDYSGIVTKTYKITGIAIKSFKITGIEKTYEFTGDAVTPATYAVSKTVKNKDKTTTTTTLIEGQDYVISYKNNIKKGTATIIATGINAYTGSIKTTYKINPISVLDERVAVSVGNKAQYTKIGAAPEITATYNGRALVYGTDYSLTLKNNKKLGTATVVINGKGNFSGKTAPYGFTADFKDIADTTIAVNDVMFTGKQKTICSAITVTENTTKKSKLSSKTDYSVRYTLESDYSEGYVKNQYTELIKGDEIPSNYMPVVGENPSLLIKVTITGKGLYEGTNSAVYTMYDEFNSIAKAKITVANKEYLKRGAKPKKNDIKIVITNMYWSESITLRSDEYEIVSVSNNTKIGTAKVTIRAKAGSRGIAFGGTRTITYKINAAVFE